MNEIFPIFVLEAVVDENEIEYCDATNWCNANLNHQNVLVLTEDELYLPAVQEMLEIVNDVNESIIGAYEDDWIIDNEVKQKIIEKLEVCGSRYKVTRNEKAIFILTKLVTLLKLAVETNHNIYFYF